MWCTLHTTTVAVKFHGYTNTSVCWHWNSIGGMSSLKTSLGFLVTCFVAVLCLGLWLQCHAVSWLWQRLKSRHERFWGRSILWFYIHSDTSTSPPSPHSDQYCPVRPRVPGTRYIGLYRAGTVLTSVFLSYGSLSEHQPMQWLPRLHSHFVEHCGKEYSRINLKHIN